MYYIELLITPKGDVGTKIAWKHVFTKVHLALVNGDRKVGISLPDYNNRNIGVRLRLIANNAKSLEDLDLNLRTLQDYVEASDIHPVPAFNKYEKYYRVNGFPIGAKVRRRMRRHNETLEQAYAVLKNKKKPWLPGIPVMSLSTGEKMVLLVARDQAENEGDMTFNTYGLSKTNGVPVF